MNSKTTLMVLSIFLISIFAVSAHALTFSPSGLTINSGVNQTTITLSPDSTDFFNANGNETVTLSSIPSITNGNGVVSFTVSPQTFSLSNTSSQQITVKNTQNSISSFQLYNQYSTNLVATASNSSGDTVSTNATINFERTYCQDGDQGGNLTITRFDVSNSGSGTRENWNLLDQVSVEVTVANENGNNNNNNINDVTLQLGLIDSNGNDVAGNLNFISGGSNQIDLGGLGQGNTQTQTFQFTVPADFQTGSYELVAKAYTDEAKQCVDVASGYNNDLYDSISVDNTNNQGQYIAFQSTSLPIGSVTCGDNVQLNYDAVNVGDQNQNRVKIDLVSSALGLNTYQEFTGGLDEGEDRTGVFNFVVPQVKDGTYYLDLSADYDYNDGQYSQALNSPTILPLTVVGCELNNSSTTPAIALLAQDSAVANAGKQLQLSATITNTGSATETVNPSASGFGSWASLDSTSTSSMVLAPGQSQDVTYTFTVNPSASGQQTLLLTATSSSGTQQSKDVTVTITPQSSLFGGSGNNGVIWLVAIINIVLIIIIIIVAVRVARR